jgi:dTMP kinase
MLTAAQGFFLVIEGLDGSGKTETARRLTTALRAATPLGEERVRLTYEPHDPSFGGEFIRQVLRKEIAVSPRLLALAYAANRADHLEREVLPFLAGGAGRVAISDRYYLSSLVYQTTPDLSTEYVMTLNAGSRPPDLTVFLDASAETCYQRISRNRPTRELFDERLAEMRHKYEAAIAYLRQRGEQIVALNADGTAEQVMEAVLATLRDHAPAWLAMPPA